MHDYRIRPMTIEDFDPVLRLWREADGVGLSPSDSHRGIAAFLERNPGLSWVATDAAGAVIGIVLCGHDGVRGYLRHLAVAPDARRAGIGRALVDRSLAGLRDLGIHKCSVFLFAHNDKGRRFWERLGWKVRADLQVVQVILTNPTED